MRPPCRLLWSALTILVACGPPKTDVDPTADAPGTEGDSTTVSTTAEASDTGTTPPTSTAADGT